MANFNFISMFIGYLLGNTSIIGKILSFIGFIFTVLAFITLYMIASHFGWIK